MAKGRVLYVVDHYPEVSESYVKREIEAVAGDWDLKVIALSEATWPYRDPYPFEVISDPARIREEIEDFKPDVLHGHWLHHAELIAGLAEQTSVPFTIRAHSFDVLYLNRKARLLAALHIPSKVRLPYYIRASAPFLSRDACLGVLTFPFSRRDLEKAAVPGEKIVDTYPVVDYDRFFDRSENGDAVMNPAACLPQKQMSDFLELAKRFPGTEFNLYKMGFKAYEAVELNEQMGRPVKMLDPIDPDDMPREYKRHRWMVYTASKELPIVGWPLAVAEAQAAGVGVCVANLRPDLRGFVGDAGYLFDTVDEVAAIIAQPFPEEKRELGFELAKRSDIKRSVGSLTSLWDGAVAYQR